MKHLHPIAETYISEPEVGDDSIVVRPAINIFWDGGSERRCGDQLFEKQTA